jgi:hypothetical protein
LYGAASRRESNHRHISLQRGTMHPTQIPSSTIRARQVTARLTVSFAVALAALAACSANEATTLPASKTIYGSSQALGQGNARIFVTIGGDNQPQSIGVAISEAAMGTLPSTPIAPSPSAATLMLELPDAAKSIGFDHVMLDWNPAGHEPDHVYTLPHFDFHFYSISQADQMQILPSAPDFPQRAGHFPDAQYVPAGYVAANVLANAPAASATVPMMGLHWIDGNATELHGQSFTSTFLWGSYDGQFIFIEPMITKAYIESTKTIAGNSIVMPLKAPAKYQHSGYYPDRYSIAWDAKAKEYRIALDGLAQR